MATSQLPPKGIYLQQSNRGTTYQVRVTADGVKYYLGTFPTLQQAVKAKVNWMQREAEELLRTYCSVMSPEQSALTAVEMDGNSSMEAELLALDEASVAPHLLEFGKSFTIPNDPELYGQHAGKYIGSKVVTLFLNKLFGVSTSSTPTTRTPRKSAAEQEPEYDWNSVPTEVDPFAAAFIKDQQPTDTY